MLNETNITEILETKPQKIEFHLNNHQTITLRKFQYTDGSKNNIRFFKDYIEIREETPFCTLKINCIPYNHITSINYEPQLKTREAGNLKPITETTRNTNPRFGEPVHQIAKSWAGDIVERNVKYYNFISPEEIMKRLEEEKEKEE